jgi:hypothetical protein
MSLACGAIGVVSWPLARVGLAQTSAQTLTYDGFLAHARALAPDTTREEIIAALGPPTDETQMLVRYNLTFLPGYPGMSGGTQVYPTIAIPLRDGRMSGPIAWGWIDVTGAAPAPARTTR